MFVFKLIEYLLIEIEGLKLRIIRLNLYFLKLMGNLRLKNIFFFCYWFFEIIYNKERKEGRKEINV